MEKRSISIKKVGLKETRWSRVGGMGPSEPTRTREKVWRKRKGRGDWILRDVFPFDRETRGTSSTNGFGTIGTDMRSAARVASTTVLKHRKHYFWNGTTKKSSVPLANGTPLFPSFRGTWDRFLVRSQAFGFSTSGEQTLKTIAWDPELKNRICLIGRAGDKPDIRYLDSGKVVARIGLAVDRPNREEPDWFDVEIWDSLAETVANQIGKGQQISISGFLKMDTWTDRKTGLKRKMCKVVATDVKNVLPYEGQQQDTVRFGRGTRDRVSTGSMEDSWKELFENPDLYWDNRTTKRNPRAPDFKHKETGDALWIESKQTPSWVFGALKKLDVSRGSDASARSTMPRSSSSMPQQDYDVPF